MLDKKVFGLNKKGIGNRLEAFALAFAIHRRYGHTVVLDWPEFDLLRIEGSERGTCWFWPRRFGHRLYRVEDFSDELARHRWVILKTMGRTHPLTTPYYLEAARCLRLHRLAAQKLKDFLAQNAPAGLIGVHLRRGDIAEASDTVYDLSSGRYQAVPLWWYESTMTRLTEAFPGVRFLLCSNADSATLDGLRGRFSIVTTEGLGLLPPAGNIHGSRTHPAVDLFALACCAIVVGQPFSSYTHWAAGVLRTAWSHRDHTLLLAPNGVSHDRYACVSPAYEGPTFSQALHWTGLAQQPGQRFEMPADFSKLAPRIETAWLPEW